MESQSEMLEKELHEKLKPILSAVKDDALRARLEALALQSLREVQNDLARAQSNLARALSMLALQQALVAKEKVGDDFVPATDLIRGVVVFTHAALEDYLRTLGVKLLPFRDASVLNDIPLAGTDKFGRAEKFSLGALVPFREKTVQEVIAQSVTGYLNRASFSSATEIAAFLKRLGIDTASLSTYFPAIEALIKRRHQIVHRADFPEDDRSGGVIPQAIKAEEVKPWIDITARFVAEIGGSVGLTEILPRMQAMINAHKASS